MDAVRTWNFIQTEVAIWDRMNFGERTRPELLLLGVLEEIGEFYAGQAGHTSASNLAEVGYHPDQIAREVQKRRDALCDALGDQAIYAVNLCTKVGLDFGSDIVDHPEAKPQHVSEKELLGVLGLAGRAILKTEQGIRGYDYDRRGSELQIALSVWYRWVLSQCQVWALGDYLPIVSQVWTEVSKRNWKANPVDANQVAQKETIVHRAKVLTTPGTVERHTISGCTCGWKVPEGVVNPDDEWSKHMGLVAAVVMSGQ